MEHRTVTMTELVQHPDEVFGAVKHGQCRYTVTKRGKPVATIRPYEEVLSLGDPAGEAVAACLKARPKSTEKPAENRSEPVTSDPLALQR